MKKILILFIVCLTCIANAQTVEFDYSDSSKNPFNNPGLKNGNFARFKLININTYAQKVTINGAVYNLNTPIPKGLQTAFQLSNIEVENSLNSSNKAIGAVETMTQVARDSAKAKLATDKDVETSSIMDSLLSYCNQYFELAKKVKNVIAFEKNLDATLSNEKINLKSLMMSALASKCINKDSIANLKKNKENFEITYGKARNQYAKALKNARKKNDEAMESKIENAQETLTKEYEKLDELYEKSLSEIDDLYLIANSDDNYNATSDPVFLKDADEIEFSIRIAKTEADLSTAKPITPNFNIGGGTKFDFSVGPVFNRISNDSYYLNTDKELKENINGNALTPGLAAMMHVSKRSSQNKSIGGMFGVNANFTDLTNVDLGFLGGLTAILGNDRKFFVSSGISFFKVDRLKKEQFKVDTKYKDTDIPNLVEKVFRPSFFVAVSLSIAKRVQIK